MRTAPLALLAVFGLTGCYTQLATTRTDDDRRDRDEVVYSSARERASR
jgi:hypothetical protein